METHRRSVIDCRDAPESGCSLSIAGTEEEVLETARMHVEKRHGLKDSPEMRAQLRGMIKLEPSSPVETPPETGWRPGISPSP